MTYLREHFIVIWTKISLVWFIIGIVKKFHDEFCIVLYLFANIYGVSGLIHVLIFIDFQLFSKFTQNFL
jgi:hypothetical protein